MKHVMTEIGGKSYEKCKVVMLPAEESTGTFNGIIKGITGRLDKSLWNTLSYLDTVACGYVIDMWEPQHLYICSHEEINNRDWYLFKRAEDESITAIANWTIEAPIVAKSTNRVIGKVIASTDPSSGLPRPSTKFLQKYCELGGIDEVLVEYKSTNRCSSHGDECIPICWGYNPSYSLQVAPDNTITTKPIKDSWTREEMISELNVHINAVMLGQATGKIERSSNGIAQYIIDNF